MKRILLFVLLIGALLVAMSTFHIGASPSETRATQALASSANNTSLSTSAQPTPVHVSGPYSVLGKPSLSVKFINKVLAAYNSPASGKGPALYALGVKYGIDPAFALAFFFHESTFGRNGEASSTLSLGNLRCIPDAACVNTSGQPCQANQSCYAAFPTWEAGFEAWYKLIHDLYIHDLGPHYCGRDYP